MLHWGYVHYQNIYPKKIKIRGEQPKHHTTKYHLNSCTWYCIHIHKVWKTTILPRATNICQCKPNVPASSPTQVPYTSSLPSFVFRFNMSWCLGLPCSSSAGLLSLRTSASCMHSSLNYFHISKPGEEMWARLNPAIAKTYAWYCKPHRVSRVQPIGQI